MFGELSKRVSSAPPFIIHSSTGSGKTLAYLIPLLTYLDLYGDPREVRRSKEANNAVIITPTTELAFQVKSIIEDVVREEGEKRGIDLRVAVVSPPQNVHLLSTSTASLTCPPTASTSNGKTSTIFVGSAKSLHASLTRVESLDGVGICPTPPPLVDRFYKSVGFVVLDEVDRLLLNGKGRTGGRGKERHKHQRPASAIASSVAKARQGRVVVVGASATVGRKVRREFCRVLGLKYMNPVVVRTDSVEQATPSSEMSDIDDVTMPPVAGSPHAYGVPAPAGQPDPARDAPDLDEKDETLEPSMVKIPSSVRHVITLTEGGGGTQLAAAASLTRAISSPGSAHLDDGDTFRGLIVLTRQCGLTVKDSVGALKFLKSAPLPTTLREATSLGAPSPSSGAPPSLLTVATEDTIRGLDLDVNCVIIVGVARNPESYTHVAGRTGRAGRKGTVYNVVDRDDLGVFNGWKNIMSIDFDVVDDVME